MAKWWCLLARKNYMFQPIAAIFMFCQKRRFSEPEDGRYMPKHVVFFLANKHHHLAVFYSCVFWLNSPHHIYIPYLRPPSTLFSVILIGISVVIARSEIFQRLWYRNLYALWDRPHYRWQIWIFHCMFGFGGDPFCSLNKSNNWKSGLLVPPKPWNSKWHSAPTIYPSCQKPCTCYTAWLRGPTCILVNHFIPQ